MATKKKVYATHVTLPTGERLYVRGRTKAERDAKVQKIRSEMNAGVDVSDRSTFKEYAYAWARAYKAPPKLRENSYATLVSNMEHHVIPFFEGKLIKDIKPMDVQMFLTSLDGLSKSVQSKCIQICNGVFSAAVDNGIMVRNPMPSKVKTTGKSTEEVVALTDEQASALLKATEGTRAYLFCLLALTTGLRRGELLGLMWEDIDLDEKLLTVTHNKTFPANKSDAPVTTLLKSEAASRVIPIPDKTAAVLRLEKIATTSPFVIHMKNGKSLTRSAFQGLWAIIETRTASDTRPLGSTVSGGRNGPIKVTLDFKCHPHQLRHTFLTQLFEKGADIKEVQYLAGHSTPELTLKIYTHYRQQSRSAETAERIESAVAYIG